jgi:uncharacterized protein (TIGR02118 family)
MYCLTVTYPKGEGSTFDFDYYVQKHMPLCAELLGPHGLRGTVLRSGQGAAPGADNLTYASVDLLFDSPESLQAALQAGGAGVTADVPNYTNVKPQMTFSGVEVSLAG